jgi:hypothetical protein
MNEQALFISQFVRLREFFLNFGSMNPSCLMAHRSLGKSVVSLSSRKRYFKKFEFLLKIPFLAAKANSINLSAKRNKKEMKNVFIARSFKN